MYSTRTKIYNFIIDKIFNKILLLILVVILTLLVGGFFLIGYIVQASFGTYVYFRPEANIFNKLIQVNDIKSDVSKSMEGLDLFVNLKNISRDDDCGCN